MSEEGSAEEAGPSARDSDQGLSIRAERFERMSLDDLLRDQHRTASPPYRHHRESTPPSHDFR